MSRFAANVQTLGWTNPGAVVSDYVVEQSANGVDFSPMATIPATQRITNSGLAANTTYYYRILKIFKIFYQKIILCFCFFIF